MFSNIRFNRISSVIRSRSYYHQVRNDSLKKQKNIKYNVSEVKPIINRKGVVSTVGCGIVISFGVCMYLNKSNYVHMDMSFKPNGYDNEDEEYLQSKEEVEKCTIGYDDDDENVSQSKEEGEKSKEEGEKSKDEVEKCNVVIELEEELVSSLPVMILDEVWQKNGMNDNELLVTYKGIVYDVTSFAEDHPGGRDLILTAGGLDLEHFFTNYTVHSQSKKASEWLAPLAVGKLSKEDAERAKNTCTPEVHVKKRFQILKKARKRILLVAITLPFWILIRKALCGIAIVIPELTKRLASLLPIAIPGYSEGTEHLEEGKSIAIIGGGIAGCGAAWTLQRSGYEVYLYEARENVSGNARTFDWDFSPFRGKDSTVKSCVSVTAWPPVFYKNYTALLDYFQIETVHQPLSWFLNSKVPGAEGTLWAADPKLYEGSLRNVFKKDFERYRLVERLSNCITSLFTLRFMRPDDTPSMYDSHTGLGLLNPLNVVPLYSLYRLTGGTQLWWDVVFTPHYTASFLVDELRPFPAVFGPLIEAQIPLNPTKENTWQGSSVRSESDCNITTCVTWKDAGKGIRQVFDKLIENVTTYKNTRVRQIEILPSKKIRVYDEYDNHKDVDRVIFACPSNAVGNIYKQHGTLEDIILSTPVYADDHHPASGHMHAVMHSDSNVLDEKYRNELLKRASNIVEVTLNKDGEYNIENQYNFGVQTPGPGIYDLKLDEKPVMLISHSLGEGKSIQKDKIKGVGNHARAHPLYSGWNVAAMLSLRLVQGKNGIYYCSNWTTPGNCHDMSLLSGIVVSCAIGAKYPFPKDKDAKKDFERLRDLMGI